MEDRGWRGSCRFLRYFFIDAPGEYYLAKGLYTFHNTHVAGILHCGDEAAVAVEEPMDPLDLQKRTHASSSVMRTPKTGGAAFPYGREPLVPRLQSPSSP